VTSPVLERGRTRGDKDDRVKREKISDKVERGRTTSSRVREEQKEGGNNPCSVWPEMEWMDSDERQGKGIIKERQSSEVSASQNNKKSLRLPGRIYGNMLEI